LRPLEGVRELRERRMLSQQELAHRAGVSLFTIQRIERGEGSVRPKTGRAIAAALGVGVEDLLPKAQAPLPDFDVRERRAPTLRSQINLVNNFADYAEQEIERREQEPKSKSSIVEKLRRSKNVQWALAMMHIALELSKAFTEDPNMKDLVYDSGEVGELYRAHTRLDAAVEQTEGWFGNGEQADVRDLDEYRQAQQARTRTMERRLGTGA
jgi:transcriptional regulator with XRE-family HTH domain